MLAKSLSAFSLAKFTDEPPKVRETAPPQISPDELRGRAQSLIRPGSVLDGIREPIRMEDVRAGIFARALGDIAGLAHHLGYGHVAGRTSSYVGGGYIYVPTGQSGGEGYNRVNGPGFRPDMEGPIEGYMNESRTSICFPETWLKLSDVAFGEPTLVDHGVNEIVTVEIDNGLGISPIETSLMIEYYTQGSVESAISRNWSDTFHWDLSFNQTVNFGDPTGMFPKASLSFNEGIGGSGTTGGSQSSVSIVNQAQRVAVTQRVSTPAHARDIYGVTGTTDHCFVPFTAMATLEFSVAIHGFLRWGGGNRFQGETNYHTRWSGNGDRPTFDFKLGGRGLDWAEALRSAVQYNSEPWNWKALIGNHPQVQQIVERVNDPNHRAANYSFPISGVIGGVTRRNVKFVTLHSEAVIAPPEI